MPSFKRLPILLALSACLAVAGCGGDDDGGDSGTPAATSTPVTTPEIPADVEQKITDAAKQAQDGDAEGAIEAVRKVCREQAAKVDPSKRQSLEAICDTKVPDPTTVLDQLPKEFQERARKALEQSKTDPAAALREAKKICEDAAAKVSGAEAATARQACAVIPDAP